MKIEDLAAVAQSIKSHRKKAKLTQAQLAEMIGKTESSIRKYEKGLIQAPINVIEDLAAVFNITPYELMGATYWDAKTPEIVENARVVTVFENYLSTLGFNVSATVEVTEWHYEEMTDDNGKVVGRGQVEDDADVTYTVTRDKQTVTFNDAEFAELQNLMKEVIETRFFKKLIESKKPPTVGKQ